MILKVVWNVCLFAKFFIYIVLLFGWQTLIGEWLFSGGRVGGASSRYGGTPIGTGMTPSYGGRTPMYGSQTPLYDGSRTPHYGAMTPSHDGSSTPGRSSAWDPANTNTPSRCVSVWITWHCYFCISLCCCLCKNQSLMLTHTLHMLYAYC